MNINEDILFAQIDGYYIYQSYNEEAQMYYLCIPTTEVEKYELFMGFPKKDLMELSKDEVINEINDVIVNVWDNGIYILPDVSVSELDMAAKENDDKSYNIIFEQVHSITSSFYKKITNNKKNIGNVIHAFNQNDSDTKFIDWLEIKLGSKNINGINLMATKIFDDNSEDNNVLDEIQDDSWTTLGSNSSEISHKNSNKLRKKS